MAVSPSIEDDLPSGVGGEAPRAGIPPHTALIYDGRRIPGLDQRTMLHASHEMSQRKRKLIEQAFGCMKGIAGLRKSRFFGRA